MLSGYRKPVDPQKPGYQKTWAITLAEICVDKNLAHQARKFAALAGDKFEALVERHEEAASPIKEKEAKNMCFIE
jgi:hypothetical protein